MSKKTTEQMLVKMLVNDFFEKIWKNKKTHMSVISTL